jgi:hypothetical protein
MWAIGERLRKDGEVRLNSQVDIMRFTLVYDGPLPSQQGTSRKGDKHAVRRQIHDQLRELWITKPTLHDWIGEWRRLHPDRRKAEVEDRREASSGHYANLIQSFPVGAFVFVPLVNPRHYLHCELDILFLRAEEPRGHLFAPNGAGDLDNRLGVLFDALRIPQSIDELPDGATPEPDDDPFFCLLHNDNLVTAVRVESERLLHAGPDMRNRVRLVIRVTLRTDKLTMTNIEIAGD